MEEVNSIMKRENWVDVARGIGIILVIIGHSDRPDYILKWIQAFHMPMFFILSGYLFKLKEQTIKPYAIHKWKAYINPYFKYGFINLVIWLFICGYIEHKDIVELAPRYIIGLLYSRGTWYWMPNCSPIWFFTALFCASIMMYFLIKQRKQVQYLIVALCLVLTYLIINLDCMQHPLISFMGYDYQKIKLIWNIDSGLWGLCFMYLGYQLRQHNFMQRTKELNKFKGIALSVMLILIGTLCSCMNKIDYISMDSMISGNFLFAMISMSTISVGLFVLVILLIPENKTLAFYGKNTLLIIGFNYVINYIVGIPFGGYAWWIQCLLQMIGLTLMILLIKAIKNLYHKKVNNSIAE